LLYFLFRKVFPNLHPVPAGFHTIAPNLIVQSVDRAASSTDELLPTSFEAEEILRPSMPDGKRGHGELSFGDSRLNLGESMKGWAHTPGSPRFLWQIRMRFSRKP
jgi:hypothetical protein